MHNIPLKTATPSGHEEDETRAGRSSLRPDYLTRTISGGLLHFTHPRYKPSPSPAPSITAPFSEANTPSASRPASRERPSTLARLRRAAKETTENHHRLFQERRDLVTRIEGTLEAAVAHLRSRKEELFQTRKREAQALIKTLQVHDSSLESANLDRLQDSIQLYEHRLGLAEGTEEEQARQEKLDRLRAEIDSVIEDGRRPYKENTEEGIEQWEDAWFKATKTLLIEEEEDEATRIQQHLTPEATTIEPQHPQPEAQPSEHYLRPDL